MIGFGVDERSVLEIFKGVNLREVRSLESNTPDAIIVDRVFHYKPIAHYDAKAGGYGCGCYGGCHPPPRMPPRMTSHDNHHDNHGGYGCGCYEAIILFVFI